MAVAISGFSGSPGIPAGVFHNGHLVVGAVQAALQKIQHPGGIRACLAQPSAAPHKHLRMHCPYWELCTFHPQDALYVVWSMLLLAANSAVHHLARAL